MKFPAVYSRVAKAKGCEFLDASQYAYPDIADGVHWSAISHKQFALGLGEKIIAITKSK